MGKSNNTHPAVIGLGMLAVIGIATSGRRNRSSKKKIPQTTSDRGTSPAKIARDAELIRYSHGFEIDDLGDLHVEDWNTIIAQSPDLLRAAWKESPRDAEQITINFFRRLFPDRPWPPNEEDPIFTKWDMIVRVIGQELGCPVKASLTLIS